MLSLTKHKHFYYWLLPSILTIVLALCNYSGIHLLQTIVSPPINREFGLLENLQNLVIILLIVLCFYTSYKRTHKLEKTVFFLGGLFFIIAFLEEIDYGLHFYEYYYNIQPEEKKTIRNLHNIEENKYLYFVRQFIIITLVLFFILLPLIKNKIENPYIKHFIPSRMIMTTFVVYVLISGLFVRLLPKLGLPHNPSLKGNHQEFEELVSYYMILLYLLELVFIKPAKAKTKISFGFYY